MFPPFFFNFFHLRRLLNFVITLNLHHLRLFRLKVARNRLQTIRVRPSAVTAAATASASPWKIWTIFCLSPRPDILSHVSAEITRWVRINGKTLFTDRHITMLRPFRGLTARTFVPWMQRDKTYRYCHDFYLRIVTWKRWRCR